jgi:hypothetical protein
MPVSAPTQQQTTVSAPDESRAAPGQQQLPMNTGQPAAPAADNEPDFDDVFDTTRDPDDPGDTSEPATSATGDTSQPASQPAGSGQEILDRIRGLGIEADDEHGALTALADRYEQTGSYLQRMQRQQEADRQHVQRLTNALLERQQPRQDPQQPAQQPQAAQSAWKRVEPLKVHESVLRAWRDPETGALRQDAPVEILQEFNRYASDTENWLRDAMHNPEDFFAPGVQAIVERVLSDRFEQHDRQRDTRTEFQQMQDELRPFM